METINNIQSFTQYFRSETLLVIGILALLIRAMRTKTDATDDRLPMLMALLFLGASLVVTLFFTPTENPTTALFGGMLALDPMAVFFKVLVLATAILMALFADKSADMSSAPKPEFYAFLLTLVLGLNVMIGANNLLVMYLAIEMASIISYILTGFLKNNTRSDEAGLKYVFYGGLASGVMIFGMSLLYGLTGTLDLIEIRTVLAGKALNPEGWTILYVTFIMILTGLGYKMAIAPFHMWSPDVYEGAPMPVTAFLSVASKAAGFAITLRFFLVGFVVIEADTWTALKQIDWQGLVAALAILTMSVGNLVALQQNNIKRFLAYSSVAHAGYLLMGLAVQSTQGIEAILLYFVVYFIMNLGAFLVAIYVANEFQTENMEDYKGLGRRKGVGFLLAFCMSIFLLSLAGLPPFAGFIGKLYLFGAVINAKMYLLAVVGVINSVVSLFYYVRLMKFMFFYEPANTSAAAPSYLRFTAVIPVLATLTLVFGLYFTPLLDLVKNYTGMLY